MWSERERERREVDDVECMRECERRQVDAHLSMGERTGVYEREKAGRCAVRE